jgi:hypothetical protein
MYFCTFLSSSRNYVKLQLLLRIFFRKISCFFPANKGNMGCSNKHIAGTLTVRVPLYRNLQNDVQFSAEGKGNPPPPPPPPFLLLALLLSSDGAYGRVGYLMQLSGLSHFTAICHVQYLQFCKPKCDCQSSLGGLTQN